ncbi:MAG: transglycosylase SLT domain-containing protein [Elusimicrobia bacterium]|nr:transglycosylase SLT domain-containing protein [Elusimicrobiota bacterium]
MIQLTENELGILDAIAMQLQVDTDDLFKLIKFESKWNPQAKNPFSSARGLIQFTDKTAAALGFKDSLDLVTKCPTISDQLPIVKRYLDQFKPFANKQELYISVFYPKWRKVKPETPFPASVQRVNPGIRTIADYVNKVEGVAGNALVTIAMALTGFFFYTF